MAPPAVKRRVRRKSRHGCRECKQRHIKCDERHPMCVNCETVRRTCSFLENGSQASFPLALALPPAIRYRSATAPLWANGVNIENGNNVSISHSAAATPTQHASPAILAPETVSATSEGVSADAGDNQFSLMHMELFDHFRTGMYKDFYMDDPRMERFIEVLVRHAVCTPYLMNQVLALSAAHMSIHRPGTSAAYRREAARLQTRAVSMFHARPCRVPPTSSSSAVSPIDGAHRQSGDHQQPIHACEDSLSAFLFATFLNHQATFEVLSVRSDLPTFLDKLVTSFRLGCGIRAIAGHVPVEIEDQFRGHTGKSLLRDDLRAFEKERQRRQAGEAEDTPRTYGSRESSQRSINGPAQADITGEAAEMAYARLIDLVRSSLLDAQSVSACLHATRTLQMFLQASILDKASTIDSISTIHYAFQWPVRIMTEYIVLVEQRRPEALIILAFYGVLIHQVRHYWIFGDSGAFMVRSITQFLGSYWADYLVWPNQMLAETWEILEDAGEDGASVGSPLLDTS